MKVGQCGLYEDNGELEKRLYEEGEWQRKLKR